MEEAKKRFEQADNDDTPIPMNDTLRTQGKGEGEIGLDGSETEGKDVEMKEISSDSTPPTTEQEAQSKEEIKESPQPMPKSQKQPVTENKLHIEERRF